MNYVWVSHPSIAGVLTQMPEASLTYWETRGWVTAEAPEGRAHTQFRGSGAPKRPALPRSSPQRACQQYDDGARTH